MSPIKVMKLILCEPFGLHPLLSNPVNDLIVVFCCNGRWIVTGLCLGFPVTNGSLTNKYRISVNAYKRIKEPWSYTYQSENVSSWKTEVMSEFPEQVLTAMANTWATIGNWETLRHFVLVSSGWVRTGSKHTLYLRYAIQWVIVKCENLAVGFGEWGRYPI